MNKKQKQNIEKLLKMLPIAIMLTIIVTIGMFLNVSAEDIDIGADVADPDCFWSDGPGSELFVASGKTCTINSDTMAVDSTGWTEYAIIVYSGGTLNVVNNDSTNVTLNVFGDTYNMGTINIGDGTSYAFNAAITTNGGGGQPGDIYVMGPSGTFNVTANAGAGQNSFSVLNDMHIGDAGDSSAATLNINDDNTSNIVYKIFTSFDTVNINDGTLTMDILRLETPNTGSSNMTIADGATVALNGTAATFSACIIDGTGQNCSVEIGTNNGTTGTGAILTVNGTLAVPLYGGDVSMKIGGGDGTGTLSVGTTGEVDIDETNTFLTPGNPETVPSNSLYIASDSPAGIITAGLINSEMFVWNQGDIDISSAASSGRFYALNHYKQNSGLNVDLNDLMEIVGTANIDGDSQIDGTLTVEKCTKITNGVGESFDVTGTFNTNTADAAGCNLTGTGTNDGLVVQGSDTILTITDGSTVNIKDDFIVKDGGNVDANGFFTVSGSAFANDLYIIDAGTMSMSDTGATDYFEADNVTINPSALGASSSLSVEDGSVFDLQVGAVNLGTTGTSGGGSMTVNGTVNVPTSSTDDFNVGDMGGLTIEAGGTVNADAASGLFLIEGGIVTIRGLFGDVGKLHIADQELQMDNSTTDAHLTIGIEPTTTYGELISEATPASNIGFDYNAGYLDITDDSVAIFADEIDIDTADLMNIDGLLQGTDQIDFNGTVATHMVGPSGEMKVVGLTDYKLIDIHQNLGVLGKLNGDDGDGDIYIDGTGTVVGGIGEPGKDSYTYLLARDLIINTNASIDVSNYENCYDPGGSPTYGGSYGGEGAGGNTTTFGTTKYTTAPIYPGTPNPVGMHGFDNGVGNTTDCGGAVYIEIHRDIQIDGAIKANAPGTSSDNQGAGSGGLIVINHDILHADTNADFTGSANIEAVGGSATGTTNSYGGGGGRIIIDSIQFDDPDDGETGEPNYQYAGGVYVAGGQTNNGTTDYAASGTIVYLGDDNNPNGTLIADAFTNSPPQSGKETYIPNSGSIIFDRIHAKNGADILFAADPITDPVSCFSTGTGSSVNLNGGICTYNSDKPDTLHINNSVTGAQSGDEPWTNDSPVGTTVNVADLDPVFSVVHRNPEITAYEFSQVEFQVNTDPGFGAGTMMWESGDTNNPYWLTNTVHDGERTEDIEYAGDTLTPSTTYYVRARILNEFDTPGLWTHMDMGNEYKFTIASAYYNIENSCSDVITILDGANPVKNKDGQRYGTGSCTFTIDTSTNTAWKVLYGMSPNGTIFSNTNGSNDLANIDNDGAGNDAQIDTTGDTSEEEYGFNISTGTNLVTGNVETDSAPISQKYDNWTPGVSGQYVFDIEDNGNEDKILEDNTLGAETAGEFDLIIHLNVADDTVADDYSLETWMILTDGP